MAGEIVPGQAEPDLIQFPSADEEPVKKKSFFQITSVRTVRSADDGESFLSDLGAGEYEGEEDDADEEGEDDDESLEASLSLLNHVDPASRPSVSEPVENSSRAPAAIDRTVSVSSSTSGAGPTNGSVLTSHSSQSKFRVVRIAPKHPTTVNQRYTRGRWSCHDYTSDVQEPTQHLPEHDRHGVHGRSPCASSTQVRPGDETSSRTTTSRKEVKFSVESVEESDLSTRIAGDKNASELCDPRELVHNLPPAASASGNNANTTADQSASRHNHVGVEEVERDLERFVVELDGAASRRLDNVLKSVSEVIRQYTSEEQQQFASVKQKNSRLAAKVTELENREQQLLRELERLKADHQRLVDENSLLVRTLGTQRRDS